MMRNFNQSLRALKDNNNVTREEKVVMDTGVGSGKTMVGVGVGIVVKAFVAVMKGNIVNEHTETSQS